VYVVITLLFCAWISLFCFAKTKEVRSYHMRLQGFKEQSDLQKKAQQKVEKILFKKAAISLKKKPKKKKQTEEVALLELSKEKKQGYLKKESGDQKGIKLKERPLPKYRLDLSAILSESGDKALEKAFIRLVEKVYLPHLSLAVEKKERFAKELIQSIKTFSSKKEGHFCEECLDKVDFQDFEMRLAFCTILKANPSLLEFISFKKSPLYFYNLSSEILEALFGEKALPGILALQKKQDEKPSLKEELKSLLRSLNKLDYEKEHFIEKMRFTKRRAPDKRAHVRISLDEKNYGLWRANPGGLSSLWGGIEN